MIFDLPAVKSVSTSQDSSEIACAYRRCLYFVSAPWKSFNRRQISVIFAISVGEWASLLISVYLHNPTRVVDFRLHALHRSSGVVGVLLYIRVRSDRIQKFYISWNIKSILAESVQVVIVQNSYSESHRRPLSSDLRRCDSRSIQF